MNIKLNGEDVSVNVDTSVAGLLAEKNADPKTVIVELDGNILKQEDFAGAVLKEGSVVEVLRFVGGG